MLFPELEQQIFELFLGYAYNPVAVYFTIVFIMYASSFGLPLPEEVVILAAGVAAHIAYNPELYPPPEVGAQGVNIYVTAAVCFFAVFTSDLLIYFLGRLFGQKLIRRRWFRRAIGPGLIQKTQKWMKRYGYWASAIFRFTPGLRFPGHFACGMTKVSLPKFIAVDGSAALLSVPTQVILIGLYGEQVMRYLKEFKLAILIIAVMAGLYFLARWARRRWIRNRTTSSFLTP